MTVRTPHILALAGVILLSTTACTGRWIRHTVIADDARIRNTPENREVLSLVYAYEEALEDMDLDALQRMTATEYYENGGTTDTSQDDYGYGNLVEVMSVVEDHVLDFRIELLVRDVSVSGDRADVLFEFAYTLQFEVADQEQWETHRDVNRLELVRNEDDGEWQIASGL